MVVELSLLAGSLISGLLAARRAKQTVVPVYQTYAPIVQTPIVQTPVVQVPVIAPFVAPVVQAKQNPVVNPIVTLPSSIDLLPQKEVRTLIATSLPISSSGVITINAPVTKDDGSQVVVKVAEVVQKQTRYL